MIGLLNNISNKKNYCSRKHHCLSANLSRCAAVQSKSLKTHSPTCSAVCTPLSSPLSIIQNRTSWIHCPCNFCSNLGYFRL